MKDNNIQKVEQFKGAHQARWGWQQLSTVETGKIS